MTDRKPYEPRKITPEQLTELHALPDAALVTAQEAAAVLRLKYATLAWYRAYGGGPSFTRVGPKSVRYTMRELRQYAKGQPMGAGVRRGAYAMLAARRAKGQVHG